MGRTAASLFVIAGLATAAHAQSFDCRSARYADEHVICKDPHLSKLDERLSGAFDKALNQLPLRDQKELADDEDEWVASRHQCGANARCIAEAYRTRIGELTGAAPPPGGTNVPVAIVPPEDLRDRPPALIPRPPFPVAERPPPPPFPPVDRPILPAPVVERAPPPAPDRVAKPQTVQSEPPAKAAEQHPSAAAEQRPQREPEQKSQTTVTVREPRTPPHSAQPGPETRGQPSADRRQPRGAEPAADQRQPTHQEARPQPTAERKQPATSGSGTSNADKEDRPERKSVSHEARRTTDETTPPAEPAARERAADTVKPASRPHHRAKQDHAAAAATAATTATTTPAPAKPPRSESAAPAVGNSPSKPSIQWVDPPPAR